MYQAAFTLGTKVPTGWQLAGSSQGKAKRSRPGQTSGALRAHTHLARAETSPPSDSRDQSATTRVPRGAHIASISLHDPLVLSIPKALPRQDQAPTTGS